MSIWSSIKSVFTKPKPKPGTIFLKPSEAGQVTSKVGGPSIRIPEPSQPTTSGGRIGSGGVGVSIISEGKVSKGGRVGGVAPTPAVSVKVDAQTQKRLQDQGLSPRQIAQVGFTGKFKEFPVEGETQVTRYFIKGKETGRIITEKGKEPRAIIKKPSKFVFEKPGVTREVTFRETGAEVLATTQVQVPPVFAPTPTKEEIQVTRREEIAARRQLPFAERIKYAYGEKGVSIRGGIRVGLETIQIGMEKVGIPDIGPLVSTRVAEDIGISMLLLGPITPTTGQIERELFEVGKVRLAGVTQEVGKGRAVTEAGFEVTRAGKAVKGIVSVKSIQQQQAVISAARGQVVARGVSFPSAKEVIKISKPFKVVEVAKVTEKEGLFLTRAMGITRTGAEKLTYRAAGVSIRRGEYIAQVGATITPEGEAVSLGLLKIKPGGPPTTFRVTGVPGAKANLNQIMSSSTAELKAVGLEATKSAVRAGVQVPPKPITQILPMVSAKAVTKPVQELKTISQITRAETIPAQKITQIPVAAQRVRQVGRQRYVQRQVVAQVPAQAILQKPLLVTKPTAAQKTLQRQRTISRLLTPQRAIQRAVPFIRTPIPKIPKTPVALFPLPRKAMAVPTAPAKYPVLVRRFGKFKIVGYGRTPGEALQIGRERVSKTLARTFAIPGLKPTKIPGYKAKKEKKEGLVFIEPAKRALAAPTEIKEIQYFKRVKGGRKKK